MLSLQKLRLSSIQKQYLAVVSASSAKLAVQPATLNGGVSGLAPSPGDLMAWLEDIKARFNAIQNDIREFVAKLIRDPRGSASDFKARLTEGFTDNAMFSAAYTSASTKRFQSLSKPTQNHDLAQSSPGGNRFTACIVATRD